MPLKDGTRANAVFWHGHWLLLLLLLLWDRRMRLLLNDLLLLQLDRLLRGHYGPSIGQMLRLLWMLLRWRLARIDYYLLLAVKGRVQPRMLGGGVGRCRRYSYHAGGMTSGRKRYDRLLWHWLCGSQQFRPYQGRLLRAKVHRHSASAEAMRASVHDGTGGVGFELSMMFGGRRRTANGHKDVLPVPYGHR